MEITSRHNPLIRRIKQMQSRRRVRRKENAFFVEGVPFVSLALDCNARIQTLLFCEPLLTDDTGRLILADQRRKGTSCLAVSQPVFEHLCQRNNPDGLAALIETRLETLDTLSPEPTDLFVALVEPSDPGNLGTILRTLDAVDAASCILVGKSTDPFHPRAVTASRGTVFKVPIAHADTTSQLFEWAHQHHVNTIASSARAGSPHWSTPCPLPALLIIGSEHEGLDPATIDNADQLVTIPMQGVSHSLNVAVATALLLYELKRPTHNRPQV